MTPYGGSVHTIRKLRATIGPQPPHGRFIATIPAQDPMRADLPDLARFRAPFRPEFVGFANLRLRFLEVGPFRAISFQLLGVEGGQLTELADFAQLLSSDSEGMPVGLMEAGACGVPAVSTRVGGIPELIEHQVTGLLTPPGDAPALADALERLLTNPRWAAEMGAAARRRVVEKFSVKLQMDRLLTLWRRI